MTVRQGKAVRVLGKLMLAWLVVGILCAGFAQEPERGGTFIIALSGDPETLNPAVTTASVPHSVASAIYGALVKFDFNFEPQPDLAESWTISEDGKTYTFHLFEGITWHDGVPFTSNDVKFTFEQVLPNYHPTGKQSFGLISSIETPDPLTVVFNLSEPFGPFMSVMGLFTGAILPQHIYEGTDILQNPANSAPVGNGPFKFVEWVRGSHIELERNENYHVEGLPYLDRIVFQILTSAGNRVLALENGEVDYLPFFSVSFSDIPALQQNPDIEVAFTPGLGAITMLGMNLRSEVLSDLRVRQAIAYGIDKNQILELVQFGFGTVATGPLQSTQEWVYEPEVNRYERDLARAQQLLEEAGYSANAEGVRLNLRIAADSGRTDLTKTAEVLREQLREIGIELELVFRDAQAFADLVFVQWDFDLFLNRASTGPDPAIGIGRIYTSSQIVPTFGTNAMGYSNPEVDRLFAEGAVEADPEARGEIYKEIQRILTDELPAVWLIEATLPSAYNANCHNVIVSPYSHITNQATVWCDR